ncbi:MAG: hypothetical protein M4D80_12555 [Myxococcota bacterium]|nr:hypothetical protein [Deltaproteobacteria bacterium]MDQ3335992.1 hypothetical protein [Myxococcota bacterium]
MLRLISILSMVFAFACGGDGGVGREGSLVGGSCASSGDCEFRCQIGDDFPQGTCVKPCNTDSDCPDDTFCINTDGGICLLGCSQPADCRGGYNCEGKENRGHGGDSLVCIN